MSFTPTPQARELLDDWFARFDEYSGKGDFARMADLAVFPLNVITDDGAGNGFTAQWDRERYLRTMAKVMDGAPEGVELRFDSRRSPHFLSEDLVVVVTDATMTMGEHVQEMRYADILVKREGDWAFQTMAQSGWASLWSG
ncbi:nuclear transport factor 2 family protein [Streptomyces sp. ACA25]|uniref:nuclear transport factor 2 family protein n=1 Tax=Streptomyces sp. ACA25 TaxID=3022596 RepID=UPI0023071CE9|nr:nuclear transport factor 2 family protein [Streptomyces sp. ACA25]MDB1089212.1 nuclear transport factor 2 family protein [Streptomyces sp. ACA25]